MEAVYGISLLKKTTYSTSTTMLLKDWTAWNTKNVV